MFQGFAQVEIILAQYSRLVIQEELAFVSVTLGTRVMDIIVKQLINAKKTMEDVANMRSADTLVQ